MKTLKTFLKEAKADYHKPHPDAQIEMDRDENGFVYYKNYVGNVDKFEGDDEPRRSLQEGHDLPGWVNKVWDMQNDFPLPRETRNQKEYDPARHDFLRDYGDEAHNEFRDHTENILSGHRDAKNAIAHYTGPSYENINKHLYGTSDYEDLGTFDKKAMNNLASAIAEHGNVPRDVTVYTGIKYHPWDHPIHNGMIGVQNPAFLSTSIDPITAVGFSRAVAGFNPDYSPMQQSSIYGNVPLRIRNLLRMNLPKGTHAIYGSPYGEMGHEKEFILHPNSKLLISPYPKLMKTSDGSSSVTAMWDAHLVHDGVTNAEEPRQTSLDLPKQTPWRDIYNARRADPNYIPGKPIQKEF